MKECPKCKEKHSEHLSMCLLCGSELEYGKYVHWTKFPQNKGLIIVFALILFVLIPAFLVLLYLNILGDFKVGFIKAADRQSSQAMVSDKHREKDKEK